MNLQGDPKANSPHLVGLSLGVNERKDGDIAGEGELVAWGPEVAFPQVSALFVLVPKAPWNWAADKGRCIFGLIHWGKQKRAKQEHKAEDRIHGLLEIQSETSLSGNSGPGAQK